MVSRTDRFIQVFLDEVNSRRAEMDADPTLKRVDVVIRFDQKTAMPRGDVEFRTTSGSRAAHLRKIAREQGTHPEQPDGKAR